jgi:hypothetical protein
LGLVLPGPESLSKFYHLYSSVVFMVCLRLWICTLKYIEYLTLILWTHMNIAEVCFCTVYTASFFAQFIRLHFLHSLYDFIFCTVYTTSFFCAVYTTSFFCTVYKTSFLHSLYDFTFCTVYKTSFLHSLYLIFTQFIRLIFCTVYTT